MSIQKTLGSIFARIAVKDKWQYDFLLELFELIFSIQGRVNYTNLARFSNYNEVTFRRNFKKFFEWLNFNLQIILLAGIQSTDELIAAVDCSYIPKAGKSTFGLDQFFSGVAGRAKKGLEISLLCLIDVAAAKAWALDVVQTPAGLSAAAGEKGVYTRVNFYIDQIKRLIPSLPYIKYYVADGYYAKTKVFDFFAQTDRHLITKFRSDARLRFFHTGPHPKGKKGRKLQYAGQVNWKKLDLRKWESVGRDYKYSHVKIYTRVLNSPHFKRDFRIVLLINTRTNKYVVLACTNLNLHARIIVRYYQLRFQIEFLFRDAKQFTGLTHCQARDEQSLDFHFNMSLSAINVAQLHRIQHSTNLSMNSFVRKAYNTRFVKWLFPQLSSKAELHLNHPQLDQLLGFGCLDRAAP